MKFLRRNNLLLIFASWIVLLAIYVFTQPYKFERTVRRSRTSSKYSSFVGLSNGTGDCYKTFLLYGMIGYWKNIVAKNFMSKYQGLMEFPRIVSCSDLNCKIRLNFSEHAEDLVNADVVVFINAGRWLSSDMWQWTIGNRTGSQRWIFISNESPLYTRGFQPPEEYAHLAFDWFASYKLDSDVYQPFGFYQEYEETQSHPIDLKNFVSKKTRSLAWMGRNCKPTPWNRHIFLDSLSSLLNIDKSGLCGDRELPWHNDEAVRKVLSNYKFYLALENSCCNDYITEKFWRSLDFGMVPIVVGASYEQYLTVAPPNSFIHVDQFESIEDMAMFLVTVGNDDEKYLEFHKWRNLGQVVSYNPDIMHISPLKDNTQCAILEKVLTTSPNEDKKLDFWGPKWRGSCGFCGYKWIQEFGHHRH